jgi:membrane protein implicated in regulation of membrane protease activity
MTPASNTLFALALFLALAVLNIWTVRRRRRNVSRD